MREFEVITSRQNPKVIEATGLQNTKKRRETGLFCFEGRKLFSEAVTRGVPLCELFLREDVTLDVELLSKIDGNCRFYRVTGSVYEKISCEKSPEGVFCVAKTLDKFHKFATIYYSRKNSAPERTLLALHELRDPGNLGSIIRSAAAFGCGGLILSSDCADLYSPKTVRASMGTLFDFPINVVDDMEGSLAALRSDGYKVYGTALRRGAKKLTEVGADERCCFLVGNEGHGLPDRLIDACDEALFIPMSENAESLNASIAASILLYHRYAQGAEDARR